MTNYAEIADYFERSLGDAKIPPPFAGAIKAMKIRPDLCARIPGFDDTVFSIIEDFLNAGGAPVDLDYFIHAVALLENRR
ncbi:hypothetical protein JCM15765_08770 [Paradesulfitobacterium aromaticivorans]